MPYTTKFKSRTHNSRSVHRWQAVKFSSYEKYLWTEDILLSSPLPLTHTLMILLQFRNCCWMLMLSPLMKDTCLRPSFLCGRRFVVLLVKAVLSLTPRKLIPSACLTTIIIRYKNLNRLINNAHIYSGWNWMRLDSNLTPPVFGHWRNKRRSSKTASLCGRNSNVNAQRRLLDGITKLM